MGGGEVERVIFGHQAKREEIRERMEGVVVNRVHRRPRFMALLFGLRWAVCSRASHSATCFSSF